MRLFAIATANREALSLLADHLMAEAEQVGELAVLHATHVSEQLRKLADA